MLGVPASNLCGPSAHVEPSGFTIEIISPPPRNGSISASSPGRAQRTPTPVGPSILCAEKANTSHPSDSTSTGRWGALCAPSTSSSAPAFRAIPAISAIGLMVPRTFDMCVTLTTFVRSPISERSESRSSWPSESMPAYRSTAPVRCATSCHGTMFEWCSISVSTTSSPSRRLASPQARATRLMDSVVLRVKTMSSAFAAPMCRAAFSRTLSYASVASTASVWMPRWMFAFWVS